MITIDQQALRYDKPKMASNVRSTLWRTDEKLVEDMKKYVRRGLRREEILDFLARDFPQYAWSYCTLDRRLQEFDIYFSDKNVPVEEVKGRLEMNLMDLEVFLVTGRCKTN